MLVLYIADTYDYQQDFRRWSNIAQLILSALIGTLMVIVLFYFPLGAFIGRTLLIIQAASFIGRSDLGDHVALHVLVEFFDFLDGNLDGLFDAAL